MNKKIIIVGVIVVTVIAIGVFIIIRQPEEVPVVNDVAEPLEARIERNAQRMVDIRTIQVAMELYYMDKGRYLRSVTMPTAIGAYIEIVPLDPINKGVHVYRWMDNTADTQKYCFWATLETDPVEYFAASHKGSQEIAIAPDVVGGKGLDCW